MRSVKLENEKKWLIVEVQEGGLFFFFWVKILLAYTLHAAKRDDIILRHDEWCSNDSFSTKNRISGSNMFLSFIDHLS